MSDLTIAELKPDITAMCPVKVYIDGQLVWDDIYDAVHIYDDALASNKIVKEISYEIVEFHHSVVRITTVQE